MLLRIDLKVGDYHSEPIYLREDICWGDLVESLDEYYYENGSFPVHMFTIEEMEEDDFDTFIPINGGEFWIEGVHSVEKVPAQPYFMNKETGEIAPSSEAIQIFFSKDREPFESVFDEWEETDMESDVPMDKPDFEKFSQTTLNF